ncbi:type II secretion system protein E [Sulfuricella denitrificans skB26]|uniref:Type II secretion system protein E n=1 Tax=Sulfuricella denitrificans (strain DSM 22764 / NBRC 105220 / skB26) TaxID=1163617 RepID=S6B5F0_SULDS|nr:GspE/PulE family protein [Sulfuricella denitrificans]BAN35762.1 type II secretion system protein E [Sulfuricella denitrificans skB26]
MNTEKEQYSRIADAIARAETSFPGTLAEDFPRILQNIDMLWGSKDATDYINDLFLNDRDNRQGFPMGALEEITMLHQLHDLLFPSFSTNPYDPFTGPNLAAPLEKPAKSQKDNDPLEWRVPEHLLGETNIPDTSPDLSATQVKSAKATDSPASSGRGKPVEWPILRSLHQINDAMELRHNGMHIYAMQGKPIGEILVHFGVIDEQTLRVVQKVQHEQEAGDSMRTPIGQMFAKIGAVDDESLTRALCIQSGMPMVDILGIHIPYETLKLIPSDKARAKQVVPVAVRGDILFLAAADPYSLKDQPFFTVLTGKEVELMYAPRHEIVNRLNMYGLGKTTKDAQDEFHDLAKKTLGFAQNQHVEAEESRLHSNISENDATIINLVNKLIHNAVESGVSDIHIELFQDSTETSIRFRRDGLMEQFSSFPKDYHDAVISRIKIMATLDISERRRPQDGKISFLLPGSRRIDLRVVTIPAIHGKEFVTIRILAAGEPLPLTSIGMSERDLNVFQEVFHRPYGLILVCGPTGSGKTTTLHSVLRELNTDDNKIWTVEDPVEIVQPHLCQVQVNNKIGVTFATVLRSLLRADPDIIMIGEMRDQETAKIALEASMTGHLVLSTLHTNSASETVSRLIDLDVDTFNLSDALLAILAQRLARKLCPLCAKKVEAPLNELEALANEYRHTSHGRLPTMQEREKIIQGWRETYGQNGKIYLSRPVGCKQCSGGYKGRIGLYELLKVSPTIRHLICQRTAASEYQSTGIQEGMRTLKQDGIEKVLRGITDITQVHSACV